MYHVELRQFPHATTAFNLTREQLETRVLRPWAAEQPFELNDRRWSPEKAKLTIYEGPELAVEDLGIGRGWGNVTKDGTDVTEQLLADQRRAAAAPPAELSVLKDALLERAAGRPVGYYELLGIAVEISPRSSDQQRLALAATAVWELLREEKLRLAP